MKFDLRIDKKMLKCKTLNIQFCGSFHLKVNLDCLLKVLYDKQETLQVFLPANLRAVAWSNYICVCFCIVVVPGATAFCY